MTVWPHTIGVLESVWMLSLMMQPQSLQLKLASTFYKCEIHFVFILRKCDIALTVIDATVYCVCTESVCDHGNKADGPFSL